MPLTDTASSGKVNAELWSFEMWDQEISGSTPADAEIRTQKQQLRSNVGVTLLFHRTYTHKIIPNKKLSFC